MKSLFRSSTKTFDEQFEQMLDQRGLSGAGRKALEELPLDKKQLLLSNHQKERHSSTIKSSKSSGSDFWKRVTLSTISRRNSSTKTDSSDAASASESNLIKDPEQVEKDFLEAVSKTNCSPDELSNLLKQSLQEKAKWLDSYNLEKNKDKINEAFISFISKGHYSPDEFSQYLSLTLQQRRDFLTEHNYRFEGEEPISALPSMADLTEKSAPWMALKISNKNSSLKSLYRNVQLLRVSFMNNGHDFIKEFMDCMALDESGTAIDGPLAFEIALERVYIVADYAAEESTFNLLHSYADQMLPDEIRLEVVKCIEMICGEGDLGSDKLLTSGTLVRQLTRCLSLPNKNIQKMFENDPVARKAFLNVGGLLGKLLGPCCFVYPELADLIISEMHELKRLQREALPFIYLISSLIDPFAFSTVPESNLLPDDRLFSEYTDLWEYRARLLALFNGIISSGTDLSTRLRRRRFFERAGIRTVIRSLMTNRPTEEFVAQVKAFNDDREEDAAQDLKDMRDKTLDVNLSIKSLESIFKSISALPDPSLLNWLVTRSVTHTYDIIRGLDGGGVLIREEVNTILALIEKTSGALAESVKNFEKQYSSDVKLQWKNLYLDTAYEVIGAPEYELKPSANLSSSNASVEKMAIEIQRLQQALNALNEEKNNKQIMGLLNSELASAILKKGQSEDIAAANDERSEEPRVSLPTTTDVTSADKPDESENLRKELLELIIKAPKPMKALQWESLPTTIMASSSLWTGIFDSAYNRNLGELLEEEQLLELFSKQSNAPSNQNNFLSKSDTKIRFIEAKLSRNLEIFLSALRKNPDQVKEAILTINSSVLNLDIVTRMMRLFPKEDVVDQILSYEGSPTDLGIGENFIHTIFSIPRILTRLKCIAFMYRFQEDISELIPDITITRAAVKELQSSPQFSYILQLVLVTGNYLNRSTSRGNAHGFKIESLLSLRATPSNGHASTPTLLHFIARILAAKKPDCLIFLDKMPNVKSASRVSVKSILAGEKELSAGFKFVKQESSEPIISVPHDNFRPVIDKFVEKGAKKIKSLQDRISSMTHDLSLILEAFGEDGGDGDAPETLFSNILKFYQDLQRAHSENVLFDQATKDGPPSKTASVEDLSASIPSITLELQPSGKIQLSQMVLTTGSLSLARKTIKKASAQ